jgi:protein tyrosine/serine phosphatase
MPFILDRLYHFHWIARDAARSAQPYLGFYGAFLRAHSIRAVVNLRGYNPKHRWWHREKAIAKNLGIEHFDIKLASRKIPQRPLLADLFDAFERAPRPLLLKCSGGQDRTSFAAALFLLHERGPRALPEAQAQFAFWPYLHRPKRQQLWLREFPEFMVEDAKGAGFADWARTSYDPQAFVDWLKARGLSESYREIQREGAGKKK